MKNGKAFVKDIWYGTKLNRCDIDKIPFLGEFKIFYNLICQDVGNVIIGIYVDNKLVQLYEYKIAVKHLDEESIFWFRYPNRYKNEGEHQISFAIGHQEMLSDKTCKKDIEWVYESKPFNIEVTK